MTPQKLLESFKTAPMLEYDDIPEMFRHLMGSFVVLQDLDVPLTLPAPFTNAEGRCGLALDFLDGAPLRIDIGPHPWWIHGQEPEANDRVLCDLSKALFSAVAEKRVNPSALSQFVRDCPAYKHQAMLRQLLCKKIHRSFVQHVGTA